MAATLSKTQQRLAFTRIRISLEESKDLDEICVDLGLQWSDFEPLLDQYYASEAERIQSRKTIDVYVDYVTQQKTISKEIADYVNVLKLAPGNKHATAVITGLKLKSDIVDKIVDKGQDFGFIEKRPETTKIIGGIMIAEMTTAALKKAIVNELAGLDKLTEKYGEADDILDVTPGPLHLPPPRNKAIDEAGTTLPLPDMVEQADVEQDRSQHNGASKARNARPRKLEKGIMSKRNKKAR